MAPESMTQRPVFQKFARSDKSRPRQLVTQLCPKSGKRYVLWKDVQTSYNDIDYLKVNDNRAVFMTDESSNIILPLRVPFSKNTYEVVAIDSSDQSDYSNSSGTDDDYDDEESDEEGQEPMLPRVQQLFVATRKHHRMSAQNSIKKRDVFLERVANARYWSSALRDKMDEYLKGGAMTKKNIALKEMLLAKIGKLEQKTSECDYKNLCYHTSRQLHIYVFSPASKMFLVLPSDVATWDDANPSTHTFRLYYICEMRKEGGTVDSPGHFHLVDHSGYDIVHQNEFFERYGGHSLRILQMIHQGYSDALVEIPSLDTFGILWGSTTETPAHGLSKDNIKDLVAKSIDYLKRLPPPKKKERLYLSNKDIGEIRGFLSIPDNDDGRGSLYRYTDMSEGSAWICRSHLHELLDLDAEQSLQEFVEAHGGNVSLEWSQVNVVLRSESEANEFVKLLKKSKSCLQPNIKLEWPATRQFLRKFLDAVDNTGTLCLELDGVMPDVQPQNSLEYKSNIFLESPFMFLTLLNFPQPGEQCTFNSGSNRTQLQSRMDENCSPFCWIERCVEFYMADGSKYDAGEDNGSSDSDDSDSDDEDKLKEILEQEEDHLGRVIHKMAALMGEGLPPPSKITGISGNRAETVTLQTGLIDMHLQGDFVPVLGPDKGRSVRQLTVEAAVPLFEPEFEDLVHCCTRLEEVNVVVHEARLALMVEHLAKHWRGDSGSLIVTLFERPTDEDEKSRILVQVSVGGRTVRHSGPALDREVHTLQHGTDSASLDNFAFKDIKCKQWNNDIVKTPLTPFQAELLDRMTATSPLSLTNFKLDIHNRSHDTLVTLQNILRRSRIGYLHIFCKPIEAHLHDMALQVLLSIEWSSVNILVLTGQYVEHWINLLGQVCTQGNDGGPRPLFLAIENIKVPPQPLTHSDALALHQMLYSSPLEELHLSNIDFQHDQDRQLVLGAVGADVVVTM
ncbi:hypothetical protein BGZ94_005975 [Podila epigama]|nr:hypothetical protein BGZ94_005975 [Podila epigama]